MGREILAQMPYYLNELKHILDFGHIARRRRMRAIAHINETGITQWVKPGDTILDVGTGKGYIGDQIMKVSGNAHVFGCDPFDRPTNRIRRVSPGTFAYADGADLPYPKGSFNCALNYFVLHHVGSKQPKLLSEQRRVVEPGGLIFIAEDVIEGYGENQLKITKKTHGRFNPGFGEPEGHHFRTVEGWTDLFKQGGLEVVTTKGYVVNNIPHVFFVLRNT